MSQKGNKKISNWLLLLNDDSKLSKHTSKKTKKNFVFSKQEVELNNQAASFVKITPQTRAKLERIPNKIGPYECKLCNVVYSSAFELAMHNCPKIYHLEYKCSECNKVFNSSANLASHKRWHRPKPKPNQMSNSSNLEISPMTSQSSDLPTTSMATAFNMDPNWLTHFYSNYFTAAAAHGLFPGYSPVGFNSYLPNNNNETLNQFNDKNNYN